MRRSSLSRLHPPIVRWHLCSLCFLPSSFSALRDAHHPFAVESADFQTSGDRLRFAGLGASGDDEAHRILEAHTMAIVTANGNSAISPCTKIA
jgi:hypothetical protein